jgi:hypothetical protein
MNTRDTLIEKLKSLPDERIAEIEDFVDFICRREGARALRRSFTASCEPAFAKAWDNPPKTVFTMPFEFGDVLLVRCA